MQHRIEKFCEFWVHQLRTYDCDPGIYALKYIIDRMELNIEQRYWICWIYANTYQIATTWVIFNEFPDYENANEERIREWNERTKSRLPYQKDQKWLRGNLADMFHSYRKVVGPNQQEFFKQYDNNFPALWDLVLKEFYKFGRYTSWMYFQALEEICGLNLNPNGLQLHHSSSWAPRAGLCYVAGMDEWAQDKHRKFQKEELELLEDLGRNIQGRVNKLHGPNLKVIKPSFYALETSLCAFYKLFRRKKGRYLGYYLDRMAEDIHKTSEKDWPGINWDLLWDSRNEILIPELIDNSGVKEEKMNWFLDTGEFYKPGELLDKLNKKYQGELNVQ